MSALRLVVRYALESLQGWLVGSRGVALAGVVTVAAGLAVSSAWAADEDPSVLDPAAEVVELRTAKSESFRNEDGSYSTQVFATPVHYRDSEGEWQKIDSRLVPTDRTGFTAANAAASFSAWFKQDASTGLFSFDTGGLEVELSLEGARSSTQVLAADGASLSYPGVVPGVDLEYSLQSTGVKENITLNDASAQGTLRFVIAPPGKEKLEYLTRVDGSVAFYREGEAEPSFILGTPTVSDAKGAGSSTNDKPVVALSVAQAKESNRFEVDVTVNAGWLAAAERVFPVTIDPQVYTVDTQDGYFNTDCPSCTPDMSSSTLKVGRNGAGGPKYAGAVAYDLSAIPPLAQVTASWAELYLVECFPPAPPGAGGGTCPIVWGFAYKGRVEMRRITSGWASPTPWSAITTDSTVLGYKDLDIWYSGTPWPAWYGFGGKWPDAQDPSMLTAVQNMVSGVWPNYGFLFTKTGGTGGNDNMGFEFASSRHSEPTQAPVLRVDWLANGVNLLPTTHVHANGAELVWQYFAEAPAPVFTRFEVHRSSSSGFTPSASTLVATIADSGVDRYRDTTARAGQTFYYKLVAVNASASYTSTEVSAVLPAAATATVTLQPSPQLGKSTRIRFGDAGRQCETAGGSSSLMVAQTPFRSLVEFDLRQIPSGATVNSALLSLYSYDSVVSSVDLHRVTSDWTEGTSSGCNGTGASWLDRNPTVNWAATPTTGGGGDFDSTAAASLTTAGGTPHWDSFTVTSLMQQWVNGTQPNFGMLLKLANETTGTGITWNSDDYGVSPALRPKLVVTYQEPSGVVAPTVAVSAPQAGLVKGTTVAVQAGAGDDGRVTNVEFLLDGSLIGSDTTAPYQLTWNSTTASRGAHTLTARATDEAGSQTTSTGVSVTVANSNAPATSVTSATASGSYSSTVTGDSPVAYWRLGEGSGTSFASSVGSFTGTWSGTPTLGATGALAGDANTAVSFSASSQYGTVPDAAALDLTNNVTIEAWVKRSTGSSRRAMFGKPLNGTSSKSQNYALWLDNTNLVQLEFGNNSSFIRVTSPAAIDTNWHYLVGTFASNAVKLYIDGTQVATGTASFTTLGVNASAVNLARSTAGTLPFPGTLDELAVYGSVLTPTQVSTHYANGISSGSGLLVSATGTDDFAVSQVEFLVDGERFGVDASSPFQASLDPLAFPVYDSSHTLTTRATDADGNTTTSASFPLTVANTTGTKYKASLNTTTAPSEMRYDPAGGSQEAAPLDVALVNNSTLNWPTASTKLRYQWFTADATPVVTTSADISIGADLAASGSRNVTVTADPPTLPTGVLRARYKLRVDLYDTGASAYFAAKGNQPLERWVTVTRVVNDELGLEKYQHYSGEQLGGGLTSHVNLFNGNHSVQWVPFSQPGRGLDSTVTLTYNSEENGSVSPAGNNWSLALSGLVPLGLPLDVHPNAADTAAGRTAKWVGFTDADGSYHRFSGNGAGTYYTPPAGVFLYLRFSAGAAADKRWALTRPDRVSFYFDAEGFPTRVEDPDGNALVATLAAPTAGEDVYGLAKRTTKLTDAGGREVNLTYYSSTDTGIRRLRGKLKRITDHAGHAYDLTYYDDGNLRSIIERGGVGTDGFGIGDREVVFNYTNPAGTAAAIATLAARKIPDPATVQSTKLYSVIDFRQNETQYTYLTSGANTGRIATRSNRAGEQTTFSYATGPATTTEARPLSRTWTYTFDTSGRVTQIQNPKSQNTGVLWTTQNQVSKVTQPTNEFVEYAYNANGYRTDEWDELRNRSTFEYQNLAVDANDITGNWEVGRAIGHISQLTATVKPVGSATTGNPTDYRWTFVNTSTGKVDTVTDPLGNVTDNSWSADGTLASQTLPSNGDGITRTTSYNTYDAAGLPTQVTDAAGGVTKAGYSANGNLIWQQDPNHASYSGGTPAEYRSEYFYDSYGRLARSSMPKSTVFTPGALIWSSTVFDANDNATSEIGARYGRGDGLNGAVTATTFDVMDRETLVAGPRTATQGGPVSNQTTYDGAGRPVRTTNPNGVNTTPSGSNWVDDSVSQTVYDTLDRPSSVTLYAVTASGLTDSATTRVTNYCFDLAGDLRSITAPKGAASFTACSNQTVGQAYVYTTATNTQKLEYDIAHRQTKATDAAGNVTQSFYNENGNTTKTTDPLLHDTLFSYDDRGSSITQVEPFDTGRTITTRWEYDPLGNVKKQVSPRANDTAGGVAPFNDFVTVTGYDALVRPVKVTLPKSGAETQTYTHTSYDANGQALWTSVPTTASTAASVAATDKTTSDYWDTGAIYSTTVQAVPRVRFDYTAEGWQALRVPETKAGSGAPDATRLMAWGYYPDGLLKEVRDIGGQRELYSFDANGNQTTAATAGGATALTISSSFDSLDQLTKVRLPKTGIAGTWLASSYGYDRHGNVSQIVDTAEENAGGSETAAGRVFALGYDSLDRPVTQTDDFRSPALVSDDERLTYSYMATGWLDTRNLQKDSAGAWADEQSSVRTYFDNGQLKTLTNKNGAGTTVESHTVSYITSNVYLNGNRAQDQFLLKGPDAAAPCYAASCTASWTYDGRDRVTQEINGTGQTTAFTLDPQGNVTSETTTGQSPITRTYTGQQLTTQSQGGSTAKYLYDAYGNTDCVTVGGFGGTACPGPDGTLIVEYQYDYKNRMAAFREYNGASTASKKSDYTYDPLDRPVTQTDTVGVATPTVTTFTYLGASNSVTREIQSGGATANKTYAYDAFGQRATIVDGASRFSYLYDPHGSTSLLIDQANAVKASYGYTGYGQANAALTNTAAGFAASTNPYRYTGKRSDSASGTLDMGARRYSASTGRFLQMDEYAGAASNLQLGTDPINGNRYALAGGNPINYVETDGHVAILEGGAGGGVGAGLGGLVIFCLFWCSEAETVWEIWQDADGVIWQYKVSDGRSTAEPASGMGYTVTRYSEEDMKTSTETLTEEEKQAVRNRQRGEEYDRAVYNRAKRKLDKSAKVKGTKNKRKKRGQPKKSQPGRGD